MKVIVTEKPSVAKDIAKVLNVSTKKQGYFEGSGYLVTWAFGHLVQLVNPDKYDEKFKLWNFDLLPIVPDSFKLEVVPDPGAQNQFRTIHTLLNQENVTEVICATDAGREGELIFRHIYSMSGCKLPIKRLWISSQTDKAIKDGFKKLKDGDDYVSLYHSALCRSESDWMVGINATRATSILHSKGQGVLSVGRVQTPVLKLLVDRHREADTFIATVYYEIFADFNSNGLSFYGKCQNDGHSRFNEKLEAEAVYNGCKKVGINEFYEGIIDSVEKKTRNEKAPLLYDLTELQKDANKKFKFTADQTLKTAQSLYEKHKIITYPRTSSRYLSMDIEPKLKQNVENLAKLPAFSQAASEILENNWKIASRMIDDKKVTDHHAIIPTEKMPNLSFLSETEFLLFQLIMTRFLAAFFPDCIKHQTDISILVNKAPFKASGTMVKRLGWRSLYQEAKDDLDGTKKESKPKKSSKSETKEVELPYLEKGSTVLTKKVTVRESQTKAPPLYTEASILAAMETAGKRIEDEELRQAMKDSGLGTPATRAQILERIIKVGYITRESNKLVPTEKAYYLMSKLTTFDIASPELTGQWEKKLSDIKNTSVSRDDFMLEITKFTQALIKDIKADTDFISSKLQNKCRLCKGNIVEMPLSYVCTNWKETGCSFSIWKKVAGKRLSFDHAVQLLDSGKTGWLTGFTSKKGAPFEGALVVEDGAVKFDFKKKIGTCPKCKNDLIEFPKSISCSSWKETKCDFVIWKQIAGKVISETIIQELLKKGKTDVLQGFKSREGNPFSAKLILSNNKVVFS